ncbi:MAG: hypothetical protein OXH68_20995 [Gammaproteobacteria bacterium]|nr:hypothetical protein [Gammaproteobacteria bacterium]
MVGTTIAEMRDISPLSGADLDARFAPDPDWIVVDGPPSGGMRTPDRQTRIPER